MDFYLNLSINSKEKNELIIEDYFRWFRKGDNVNLTMFFSGDTQMEVYKRKVHDLCTRKDFPKYSIVTEKVSFSGLKEFYSKPVLLNEIINYNRDDIFRIYKLMNPTVKECDFENQPISIQYDIFYDRHLFGDARGYSPETTVQIKDMIDFLFPVKILDAGCGCGANYFYLKDALKDGTSYHGVDFSRYNIIKAIDYFSGDNVSFSFGDIRSLEFDDGFFDFSFTESVLPYVSDPLRAVKELYRVSEKGFYAAFYSVEQKIKGCRFNKDTFCYELDTGASWKFYKNTPNTFYLPRFSDAIRVLEGMEDKLSIRINQKDQFFGKIGINTKNIFIYPKAWYESSCNTYKKWNNKPLM
ncbi:MAG TPA: class I SAM-dependent methyltransferase [Petrotogaceae bacterium]|jgi:ubiquinone/menaquinone biosynthesis C-methylase UbiE|nr:class I SAM-dependent methyltransferase [Petrotogaceae bacterium]HOG35219.1 class I SAM-dependent methyltransferase [Petrotogaceae bacterium]